MGVFSRMLAPFTTKSVEGAYRPGPYWLPVSGGWLPADSAWNFWQLGYDVQGIQTNSMVEACVSSYAQTVAMCPGDHWRSNVKGGRDRVTTSALSRLLHKPNDYQSISDFLLNATRSLYLDGNAYALALRNDRFEIESLHLMNSRESFPRIAVTGDIFYTLGGNPIVEQRVAGPLDVPARDVLHIRLQTPRHPLIGESPLCAAAADIAAAGAMTQQQYQFYLQQARPSIVLQSDQPLTADQVGLIRARWDEQSKGLNAGGTPILTNGLKPIPLTMNAKDSELAEVLNLTDEHIAEVFRIPLQILGKGQSLQSSTEALMQQWIATGLGFCLNHIEVALDGLFGLRGPPTEYTEFDTAALLRSLFKDRVEALAHSTMSGIHAPDEARAEFELPQVSGGFGEEPRMQQQQVPLSAWEKIGTPAEPATPAPPAAPPAPGPEKDADDAAIVARSSFRRTVYADAA